MQLNKTACHFFVIISIAEEERERLGLEPKEIDLINIIRVSQSKGWIDSELYVRDCLTMLKYLTGKTWTRKKVTTLPPCIENNQYTECNWYNPDTKKEHFTRRNIDTLVDSITVKNGYIRYYYIYTCME